MVYGSAKSTLIILIFSKLSISISGEYSYERSQLSSGSILGGKLQTRQNTTAYIYLGIPYGEAPIGNLRYRAPIPKQAWSGLLNAQQYKASCLQNSSGIPFNWGTMSEDCLLMNVFTSENCLQTLRPCPVIYYIHGGKWRFDSPTMFDPEFLANNFAAKDVVLITVTYRLGSFGFLNTGKKTSAAKNVGLLDITEGLRWVQREVGVFGGDKKRITIMGHSAGAIIVDILSLLPSVAGLFNQIVIMSAPMDDPLPTKDSNVQESKALAIRTGCANDSTWNDGNQFEAIIECLRSKSGQELLQIQRTLENENMNFMGPTIEDENGFIVDELSVLRRNRSPYRCLMGTLSSEFREIDKLLKNGTQNQQLLQEDCEKVAGNRGYRFVNEIGQVCAKEYSKQIDDAASLSDDDHFHLPVYEIGEALRSKGATVFKYSFDYEGIDGAVSVVLPIKLKHANDMVYVMGLHMGKFTQKDELIREIYSSAFVNFAKTGDPTMINAQKWQPTDDRNNYFKIDFDENLKMPGNTNGYHADAVEFWTVTAKNLDNFLAAYDAHKALLELDINAVSLQSSCCKMDPYRLTFVVFISVIFVAALLYSSRRRDKNLDPETTKLNVNMMKLYS